MTLRIIAGLFKGRQLKSPKSATTRPTQGMLREAVFNICQNEVPHANFLDLFAGSGAMSFEALSRGASHATLVEQDRNALACIRENSAILQIASQVTLIALPAERAISLLKKQEAQFTIIYIDPPYDMLFDLSTVIPLLAPQGLLLHEERLQKEHSPYASPHLEHKDTRRFGSSLLSIYRKA